MLFFRRDLHRGSAGRIPGSAGGGLQELAHPLDGQQAEERGKNKSTECASVSDPGSGLDSIRSEYPYPDLEFGSRSRRAKMTHKSRKNQEISCFEVLVFLF
jgi:hypothetical protein